MRHCLAGNPTLGRNDTVTGKRNVAPFRDFFEGMPCWLLKSIREIK